MKHRRILSILLAAATAVSVAGCSKNETSGSESSAPDDSSSPAGEQTASNVSANGWEFNQVAMGGGGFVSGVFATSQEGLYYARTDVGGAYRYNKDTQLWESMSYGISEDDQGFLGIAGLAYGDKDPNRVYLLAGTSYLSGGRTALFISNEHLHSNRAHRLHKGRRQRNGPRKRRTPCGRPQEQRHRICRGNEQRRSDKVHRRRSDLQLPRPRHRYQHQ